LAQTVAVLGSLLLLAPATAGAKNKPGNPGSSAAVQQYVEQIPTSTGLLFTVFGKPHTKPLPAPIQKKLTQQGGQDAPLLQQVATSSAYGAPQQTLPVNATPARKPEARPRRVTPARPVNRPRKQLIRPDVTC
jgi:hypothetical protein